MEDELTLDGYLSGLRRAANLSVEEVCARTKIQPRFVESLEAGRFGEVPSNTHLRAFSLALAKACGGDEAKVAGLVQRLLAAAAPVGDKAPSARSFDTPPPPPSLVKAPLPSPGPGAGPILLAPAGLAPRGEGMRASSMALASARLRSLPLAVLLSLLALAGTLSYGAAWSVERWRQHLASATLENLASAPEAAQAQVQAQAPALTGGDSAQGALSAAAPPAPASLAQEGAAGEGPAGGPARTGEGAQAQAQTPADSQPLGGTVGLTLRARRPCWLVLQIDGKRLPTITMQDGDKLNWAVSKRAVLLAGNLGALRVWWQGDNQGYLGELGARANAVVFEPGHAPHLDKSAALKLPAGVPE